MADAKYREVLEGETRLLVPEKIVLLKEAEVFYNPVMELNRDLSVLVAGITKPKLACDLLSGSGARGIRLAKEAGVDVVCNDLNPVAVDLIKKNAALNKVGVKVTNQEGNAFLEGKRLDYLDIDPFGSPSRFMDAGVRAVNHGGILALTATDTAALCGSSPRACLRKYDAHPYRADCYNELGLRILLGFVARNAARHGKGIRPLFSHCTKHYFRAYIELLRGPGHTTNTQKHFSYLQYCDKCLYRKYETLNSFIEKCPVCGGKTRNIGPLWNNSFAEPSFCRKLLKEVEDSNLGKRKELVKLIKTVEGEQMVTLPYYNVHKVASRHKKAAKSFEEIVSNFGGRGVKVYRTHFLGLGLRIQADYKDIKEVIADNMQ